MSILGRFVWFDLNTTDPQAAIAFYKAVLGWDIENWDMGGTPYPMWKVGDGTIGGVMPLAPEALAMGAPPHWVAYIATPDVDATVARAANAGAAVFVPPMDIPQVGRFAVLADPFGAVFAVFTPSDPDESLLPPALGHVSWNEIAVPDLAAGWEWYKDLFDWQVFTDMDMGPMGVYRIYGCPGTFPMGGMYKAMGGMPPSWCHYVRVALVDAAVETCKALGGNVLNGPMDLPDGDRVAVLQDPQGAVFGIHQVNK